MLIGALYELKIFQRVEHSHTLNLCYPLILHPFFSFLGLLLFFSSHLLWQTWSEKGSTSSSLVLLCSLSLSFSVFLASLWPQPGGPTLLVER